MIALAPVACPSAPSPPQCKAVGSSGFLKLLPLIRSIARHACRGLPPDCKADALQEIIASAFVAYARLAERGREQMAFASPLARYAIAHYRTGRRVGNRLNMQDVMSSYCQQRKEVSLQSLTRPNEHGGWEEMIVEDQRSTPADVAAMRIDFRAWLRKLGRARRCAAKLLASGITTTDAARELGLSPGRVSQLRRELQAHWQAFQGQSAELVVA